MQKPALQQCAMKLRCSITMIAASIAMTKMKTYGNATNFTTKDKNENQPPFADTQSSNACQIVNPALEFETLPLTLRLLYLT